jgi:glycosyltransferase involved in cell wall biosynthesis
MRILFLSQRAHPSVGGIENYQWQVATGLVGDDTVTILAERVDSGSYGRLDGVTRSLPAFEPIADAGVTVRQLRIPRARRLLLAPLLVNIAPGTRRFAYGPMRRLTASWYARRVAPVLDDAVRRHDIVHVWGGDYLAAAAVAAARRAGTPVVITPFAHEGQWGDDPGSAAAYRRADAVIGLLEADADLYRRLGVEDARAIVCGVCSPGVEPGLGAGLRRRHAIDGPLVLFLGVRRPYKGFDKLLAAAPEIAAAGIDVTLAFVGPGPAVVQPDLPIRVIDAGAVDDEERAAWLDAADLLALPSDGEIFPVSILEAFSVGTPVLTSEIPTLRELVERSGGGLWSPREPAALGRAVADAVRDPAGLERLGTAGRAFWHHGHTVDAVVRWHRDLYAQLAVGRAA